MGGFAPTLAMSALKMGMDAAQQKSAVGNQADQIREAQRADLRDRQDRLKRALATQRARFGAQGVLAGQSSEATLRGFVEEANRDAAETETMASLRISRLQDDAGWTRRRNLLQLAGPIRQSGSSLLGGQVPLID